MTRNGDQVDDQKYYDIVRRVDSLDLKHGQLEERVDKHEGRFEKTFEKLTDTLTSMDKKLEVFIQTQDTKFGTMEKMLRFGVPLIIALISGLWAYSTFMVEKDNTSPQTQLIQPSKGK